MLHRRFHIPALLFVWALSLCTARADFYTSLKSFTTMMGNIEARYVDTVNIDQLSEVAIKAVLKELDPHSTYLSPREVKQMQENLGGGFSGIGVSFRMDNDTLVVMRAIEGGPSARVGIQAGDLIVSCNDSVISGAHRTNDAIRDILRGERGTIAHLGVIREGQPGVSYYDVRRSMVPVPSAQIRYMVTDRIGYICVDRFSATTADEVEDALHQLLKQGMQDLIIDLRGNGGGYLNAAVNMSGLFIPSDQTVVYTEGRNADSRKSYNTQRHSNIFDGRLVVMIDEASASASEIFAGCMQDYDRGVIVGRRSFGKGLVQTPIELPNGGMVRLTVSHYFTPSGRCIQKPYVKGDQKSYNDDLLNRIHHGELVSPDSIRLVDSLRYQTRSGRYVYGGGGIMPDCFVPLDTTLTTPAHRAVMARSSMVTCLTRHFRTHHRAMLAQYPTIEHFIHERSGYRLDDDVVLQVIDQARHDSVTHPGLDSLFYNDYFRRHILAYMANNLYDVVGYNRIMTRASDAYLRALGILSDPDLYDSYLRPQPADN